MRAQSRVPFKELSRAELRRLSRLKHISKNRPKSSKIPDYTRRAHVLRDEVTHSANVHVNRRAKGNPIKAVIGSQS